MSTSAKASDLRTLSAREVSEATGIPLSTVHLMLKRGDIPSVMPAGLRKGRRVRVSALLKWMDEAEKRSQGPSS